MTPTAEQSAIVDAARNTTDNLLIRALAGAAKTSTLVLIAKALPKTSILCVAFNKKIAVEMQERLPGNCTAKTLNSLGNTAWRDRIGRWSELDFKKTFRILSALIEDLEPADKKWAYDNFSDLKRNIDAGKTGGYVPTGQWPEAKRLMDDAEFFASLDEEPSMLEMDLYRAAANISIREAFDAVIDFNDQILMPTVFSSTFQQFPLVMVDEAQDLSALNHAMLRKFARKRLIAVGDECQAIYGFRGAHENSMDLLKEQYSMKEFGLSISFRCPVKVVEEARWRAPHMRYPEWAKYGTVQELFDWNAQSIPDFSAVICRNNAPLFSLAIRLLKNGRYPELVGNDLGAAVVKWLKKLGPVTMDRTATLEAIDAWEEKKAKKSRTPEKVADQADCLRVFATHGKTLGDAIAYAEHVLSAAGPVKLMTGHKSKGLEFEDVFFLDEHLVKKEGQDLNLKYVIQTRSKSTLTYVKSEDFEDNEEAVE